MGRYVTNFGGKKVWRGDAPLPDKRPQWLRRLLSDARDLWTLLTKGQPVDDPFLPWRMAVEFAKLHIVDEDIDAWEGRMYALPGNHAFWFAHDRYAGTPYDWVKKPAHNGLQSIANATSFHPQQAYGQYVNGLQHGNYMNAAPKLGNIRHRRASLGG